MKRLSVLAALLAIVFTPLGPARATTVDFESFADSEVLSTQIAGLTFTHATVLTAGVSLNEFEFPPHSGANVAFDDGGAMAIVFDELQANVSGYFTYLVPLTLSAFGADGELLGSVTSAFRSNLALSGDPGSVPNELLSLAFAVGIKSLTIEADSAGASFTLDDLTLDPATQVAEPSLLVFLALGFAGAVSLRARCRA